MQTRTAHVCPCMHAQVPANKSLILEGPEGSLAKFGIKDLTFTHTPGHCKGHVVYHHKPSGYMLAGDFADVIKNWEGNYFFKTMCARTCNMTDAHDTVCRWGLHTLFLSFTNPQACSCMKKARACSQSHVHAFCLRMQRI